MTKFKVFCNVMLWRPHDPTDPTQYLAKQFNPFIISFILMVRVVNSEPKLCWCYNITSEINDQQYCAVIILGSTYQIVGAEE